MRRLLLAALALALPLLGPAAAQEAAGAATKPEPQWRHGTSLFGDLKYPPGFQHFDYVNPAAPKGGAVRLSAAGSYDSFNPFPVRGQPASGIGFLYQMLTEEAQDEPASDYGSIAEAVKYPDDFSWVTFRLNPKAKWNDGTPITADDVIWSFDKLRAIFPTYVFYYKNVVKAEVTGEREVTFTFDKPGNRELPKIMGQLFVVPKHWWTANGPDGKPRDIAAPSLEIPLGSGPYRIRRFDAGRSITYERVKDWWGADLPTARGRFNFDEIRYDYYQDIDVQREAFKGGAYDFQLEMSANRWASAYDIPAVREGRIVKQEFPENIIRMQGYVFNLRRDKFQDPRVRRAFNLAFDFEEANKILSYGLNRRTGSYFGTGELASRGLPEGEELAILEQYRDKLPPDVFTKPYANPVNGTDEARRANLREALGLLKEAGWEVRNGKLTNVKTGQPMVVELLEQGAGNQRLDLMYKASLARLGIDLNLRVVDTAQYQARRDNRDFDMATAVFPQSQSPGNEQREFWGSAAADQPGSRNVVGIKNPVIDALIDRIIYARSRGELVATTRALDRVLLAGNYLVPHFGGNWRTLRWNRFSGPATVPSQSSTGGFPDAWWYDQDKAAKLGAGK